MTDLNDPALGMSFSFQIDEKRQIVFQTHIQRDISKDTLDGLLDKICATVDRQINKYQADAVEKEKEDMEKTLRQMVEDLDYIDTRHRLAYESNGKRGPQTLSAQQKTER